MRPLIKGLERQAQVKLQEAQEDLELEEARDSRGESSLRCRTMGISALWRSRRS